jgi:hypothetical protein
MDFLVSALKRNPNAVYADLKAKADEKKLPVYPIMFGRAKALLGLVKSAKRGTGKAAKAAAARKRGSGGGAPGRKADASSKSGQIRALLGSGMSAAEIAKKVGASVNLVYNVKSTMGKAGKRSSRGPGRPRKAAAPASLNGLDGILAAVKNSERDRTQMRAALERIQAVVADALA